MLVKATNWLSHLEFDWNSPVWQRFLDQVHNFIGTGTPAEVPAQAEAIGKQYGLS